MDSPLRVLMVSKACIVGIYQRKLEEIARLGIDLRVIVPPSWRDERGEMYLERAYTEGYALKVLPLRINGNFHLHHYAGLRREIRAFQPHIVHIDEEPYNLVSWLAHYHARRVGARSLFFSWQNIYRRYPPPFSWGERWLMRTTDYMLVGTDSAGDVWRQKGFTGKLSTIPQFGIDPELFHPAKSRPSRPFTIGFIGRLVEEKGLSVLFEAVAMIPGEWRLIILGGGPLADDLKRKTADAGLQARIDFIGQVASTDMPAQYHTLDVLALPSLTRPNWKEQFGRVLIEAMASEVPVIGSDSGAIPGVIGEGSIAGGLVVPEGDASALYDALTRLRDDPVLRSRLGAQGRRRVLANFTHEQIAKATVSVYHEIIAM